MPLRAHSWEAASSLSHRDFPAARLAAERQATVSVCIPARDEQATIGRIVERLIGLRERGVLDQVLVVDGSRDDTPEIARSLGAEVHSEAALRPELGPVLGKGDAMWRSLGLLTGEVVVFIDADSADFGEHFACGLIGPLLTDPSLAFVKGFYRRPFQVGGSTLPDGGGRVTELCARPLLNLFYPELAAVRQPLAGEMAIRRELLHRLPFTTGYGVEIALLIDAYREAGLAALAQVDLDVRQNAHQPLQELGAMAFAVLQAVSVRLEREGRLQGPLPRAFLPAGSELPREIALVERPPLRDLRTAA